MKSARIVLLATLLAFFAGACSSSGPSKTDGPAWVHQPARTVDAGYIVYVGNGEDAVEQRAAFKAEGQALQDLANECSFPPKGARVEDRYETDADGVNHQAYAKVAVDFQSCEDAKGAMDADQIKKIANVSLTDEVKRYQEMMNEPPPPPVIEGSTAVAEGSPPGYWTSSQPGYSGPHVVLVNDQPSFFIVRQQVAYVKETVILAPPPVPGAPPPPPPAQQLAAIQGPSRQIRNYEQANPTLRTAQPTWSQARTSIPAQMGGARGAPPPARPQASHPAMQPHQQRANQNHGPARRPPGGGRRKKRKRE